MTITQFGRIEVDPNRVPTAAPGRRSVDGDAPFARELSAASERRRAPQPTEREAAAPPPPAAEAAPATTGSRPEESPPSPPGRAAEVGDADDDAGATGPSMSPPQPTDNGAGGAERRIRAGKETASPASTSLPAANAVGAGVEVTTAPPQHGNGGAPATSTVAAETLAAPRAAGTPPTPAAPGAESRVSQAAATAPRAAAGYRSLDPHRLQMAQDARDSIFKQIALQLGENRSEMRVLINPPELGHLDLRLIVDKSGALQLSIIAERPELAAMLDRNATELRQLLQAKGFGDVQTHVQAGDSGAQRHPAPRGRPARTAPAAGGLDAADFADAAPAFRRAGFITADGIDFFA